MDQPQIRVLIADDHALFRRGLRMVLEDSDDLRVVAEVDDGAQAVQAAELHLPDVVVMDLRMPVLDGIQATERIKQAQPGGRVLVLTVSDEDDDVYAALRAGASGYLLKEVSAEEIGDAIRAIHAGQSLISPTLASRLLDEFAALVRAEPAAEELPAPRLTAREMQVLEQLAQGHGNRQIAAVLAISENTVRNHVRNILEKLHLHSRMEAVVYAVREQLLDRE